MNQVAQQINSMGMKIKASKCRLFSLTSGKPSKIKFNFEGTEIPSIANEEQKFLGRVLFYNGKSEECFFICSGGDFTSLKIEFYF